MPNPVYVHPTVKIEGAALDEKEMDNVMEFVVDQAIFLPSAFTLVLYDKDMKYIDDERFTPGKKIEFAIKQDYRDQKETGALFSGIITAIEPEFRTDDVPLVRVRGYDLSYKLTQGKHTRVFAKQNDSDIVSKICSEAGLSGATGSTSTNFESVIQYNQTDWDFLATRARRNGFVIWCDGKTINFKNPPSASASVELEWKKDLIRFEPRLSALGQLTEAKTQGWDRKEKKAVVGNATEAAAAPFRAIGYPKTGKQTIQALKSATSEVFIDYPMTAAGEAKTVAKSALMQAESTFVRAEGVADGNPKIKAGEPVKITKVGTRFSGSYFVTQAQHIYTHGKYTVHFSASGYEPETLAALLEPEYDRLANTRIDGVVTAIVTNSNDPDKLGRVKVKFPWMDDQLESSWAPLAIPGGGKERGIAFVPEVNDEVLIAFDHGDINFPYVLGGLWNGKDAMPAEVKVDGGKTNTRVIKSRTGHLIILNDESGKESITIKDKTGENTIVIDSQSGDITMNSKQKLTITSGGDMTLDSKGKLVFKSAMDTTLNASAKVEIKATGPLAVESSAPASFKGATVEVNGSGQTAIKGGGMVEITGGLVKIN